MIRNIIFDWSGTLVDDLPAVWRATNFVFEQAGREALSLDRFRSEFCLPFTPFYERHLPGVAMEQLESWFHARFREVQDTVEPLPHARDFLAWSRERGMRTFLLSTVHPDHWQVQSARSGLGSFIDRPYTGVRDKRKLIHQILAENGLAARETIFIGDMEHDVVTAKHGGIGSVAVLTGYNHLHQLRAADPDVIVEHLGELRALLERGGMALHAWHTTSHRDDRMPVSTVGALIFDASRRVLLVRTHKWSNLWGIPGGKIRWGERSEDALRRELKEETNLDVSGIQFVMVQDCIHSKEFCRDEHFLLLNYTCHAAGTGPVRLNDEAREFCWATTDEAMAMDLNRPTRVLLEAVRRGIAD